MIVEKRFALISTKMAKQTIRCQEKHIKLELQWRKAPPCSSCDAGIVAPLIFSPSVESLN